MQLLNKLYSRSSTHEAGPSSDVNSASTSTSPSVLPSTSKRELPTFNLYQCEPREGALDIAEVEQFFPALRKANGDTTVEGSGGAGLGVRFMRYQAGDGVNWKGILLPQPEAQRETKVNADTESEESSSWWSALWKTTPNAEQGVVSATTGNVSKISPTRGVIMCLPKT